MLSQWRIVHPDLSKARVPPKLAFVLPPDCRKGLLLAPLPLHSPLPSLFGSRALPTPLPEGRTAELFRAARNVRQYQPRSTTVCPRHQSCPPTKPPAGPSPPCCPAR